MPVTYQDYYQTLGVPRDATEEQIRSAYRKLARRYHPDVNKSADATERFKQLGEAYEVLKDAEKRRRYDALGANWREGQEFTPPPGWGPEGSVHYQTVDLGDLGLGGEGADFSDFFSAIFGGGTGTGTRRARRPRRARGEDVEAELAVPLEDVYRGAVKTVTLSQPEVGPDGRLHEATRSYEVRIPPGTREGARLRLAGQGTQGAGGGASGDLYMRIRLQPHPRFRVEGADLHVQVPVAPWEAALGAEVPVSTLDGTVQARLPAGTGSGRRLRLRGLGLPDSGGRRGDLYAEVRVDVPRTLAPREKELFEELRRVSSFDPRR